MLLEQHYNMLYWSAISQNSEQSELEPPPDDFDPTDYNGDGKPDGEPCDACAKQPNKKLKPEPCDTSAKEAKPPDLDESALEALIE